MTLLALRAGRWCALLLSGAACTAHSSPTLSPPSAEPVTSSVPPSARMAVVGPPGSPGEQEVRDKKSRLVWRRCVEGMSWHNGTCTGTPRRMELSQAQALALAEYKATGVRWRLPHVTELRLLLSLSAGQRGAQPMDPLLFPATPEQWHWSGSTTVRGGSGFNQYDYGNIARGTATNQANSLAFMHGWAVHMGTGEAAGDVSKKTGLLVRLVRPDL